MHFSQLSLTIFYIFIVYLMSGITGDPVGYFSAPLKQIAVNIQDGSYSLDYMNKLTWINLSSTTVNVIFDILYCLSSCIYLT